MADDIASRHAAVRLAFLNCTPHTHHPVFPDNPLVFHFSGRSLRLLALGFASDSHDSPRAEAGKVIVTGHERKYRSPHGNQKETLARVSQRSLFIHSTGSFGTIWLGVIQSKCF
jgi:hypothetical protein